MEKKKEKITIQPYVGILIIILLALILGGIVWLIIAQNSEKQVEKPTPTATPIVTNSATPVPSTDNITMADLVGTYQYVRTYQEEETIFNVTKVLTLKSDGTSTYHARDGYVANQTAGTITLQNQILTYTGSIYDYQDGINNALDRPAIYTFKVLDKTKIQLSSEDGASREEDKSAILTKISE